MRWRCQNGFTLVELVIAILILSIAVGTLLGLLASVVDQTVLPEVINRATYLAEQELERISGLRFSEITDAGPTAYGGNFTDYTYQIEVDPVPTTLATDPAMNDYKQVRVTVAHSSGASAHLTTIMVNN